MNRLIWLVGLLWLTGCAHVAEGGYYMLRKGDDFNDKLMSIGCEWCSNRFVEMPYGYRD